MIDISKKIEKFNYATGINWGQFNLLPYIPREQTLTESATAFGTVLYDAIFAPWVQLIIGKQTREKNSLLFDYRETKIWDSSTDILPFEGVYVGYAPIEKYTINTISNDIHPFNMYIEGSILNLPEFIYETCNFPVSSALEKAYFYFLNSLPFNPPYPPPMSGATVNLDDNGVPISTVPLGALQGRYYVADPEDSSPSMFFKNSAGIYSVPTYYMHWLGGMWKYYGKDLAAKSFIELKPSSSGGFYDLVTKADEFKKNTNFFLFGDYDTYTEYTISEDPLHVLVNFDKIKNDSDPRNNLVKFGSQFSGIEADQIVGFGNYPDLFYNIYNNIYTNEVAFSGTTEFPSDNLNLFQANIYSKLRTFLPYKYVITEDNDYVDNLSFKLYGTYSTFSYTTEILGDPTSVEDIFILYSYIWKYFYAGTDYDTTHRELFDKFKEGASKISISTLNKMRGLFNQYGASDGRIGIDLDLELYAINAKIFRESSVARGYTTVVNPDYEQLCRVLDLIGAMALRFKTVAPLAELTDDELLKYRIADSSFVFCLYPSGGGINTLPLGMQNIDYMLGKSGGNYTYDSTHVRQFIKTEDGITKVVSGEEESDAVSGAYINMMLNSCHWLWYTGPYIGVYENTNVTQPHVIEDLSLSTLNTYFLHHQDEFTRDKDIRIPKEERCYILSPDHKFQKQAVTEPEWFLENNPLFKFKDIINYIGTNVLDEFKSVFEENSANIETLLYSLLIVDKGDFVDIVVDGVQYNVSKQLDLLLLYDILLSATYENDLFGISKSAYNSTGLNLFRVLNTSLTTAQANKAQRLMSELLTERKLLNIGSVFEYVHYDGVYNMFHNVIATSPNKIKGDGEYVRKCLFGDQTFSFGSAILDFMLETIIVDLTLDEKRIAATHFWNDIGTPCGISTFNIAKDFFTLYCKYIAYGVATVSGSVSYTRALNLLASQIEKWVAKAETDMTACMSLLSTRLNEYSTARINAAIQANSNAAKNDLNKLKTQTYYNIKSLFDNYMNMDLKTDKMQINYNYNSIPTPNSVFQKSDLLMQHFVFLDRANRDIGNDLLIDVNWLSNFFINNSGFQGNTNLSLYSFLSAMAQQHSSIIHSLPAFINLGSRNVNSDYARELFDTYDYVDVIESSPKFIFQFIGNMNTLLNTSDNDKLRSSAKSYTLSDITAYYNAKTNSIVNLKTNTSIPDDMKEAKTVSFIVNFGAQEQQIFSNLQLDQNEYQNTEESYRVITDIASNQSQTQSANLLDIYTARSYTATIDSLGNLMIQPLMFFDLVNIPLFYGNYWITNVKHKITPNDIVTTFKGVRQPYSVLPKQSDVLLQLAEMTVSNLIGISAETEETGTSGGGTTGGGTTGGATPTTPPKSVADLLNQVRDWGLASPQTTSFDKVTSLVIKKFEGGYYHPDMFLDGRIANTENNRKVYKTSGETMFGIDRGTKTVTNNTAIQLSVRFGSSNHPDTVAFWQKIDQAGARNGWTWNYKGGGLENELRALTSKMIKSQPTDGFDALMNTYFKNNQDMKDFIMNDRRQTFHFSYGVWNGSGHFKYFVNWFKNAWNSGITNSDALAKEAIRARLERTGYGGIIVESGKNMIPVFNNDLQNLG